MLLDRLLASGAGQRPRRNSELAVATIMTIQLTSRRNGQVLSLQSDDGKDEIAVLAPEKGHYNLMLYSALTQEKLQIGREPYKQGYRFELSRSLLSEADDWVF